MKRILVFTDSLGSGGAQRQAVGLIKLLKDEGYQVKLIYYHPIEFYKPFLDENEVKNECVKGASDTKKRILMVARAIQQYKPEVVISYLDTPNIISCLLKVFGLHYKLIVSERNTTQLLSCRDKFKFFLMRFADAVVPNSFSQETFIKLQYPSLMKKVTTITNFVDTITFSPSYKKKKNIITRIVVLGRVAAQKNTLLFLDVVNNLKGAGYRFKVDWFGYHNGKYYDSCERKIDDLDLFDVFSFHEPTKSIVEEYQNCDVFCLPSLYEGFPNVICEAMCCGVPILCGAVCDNPQIVEDEKNGYLFNPNNIEDITQKFEKFFALSQVQKDEMGRTSRELSLQKFSAQDFIDKYIMLIEK